MSVAGALIAKGRDADIFAGGPGPVLRRARNGRSMASAPEWVPAAPCGSGDRLLHMDLHPLNVLMTPRGPVVIDWPNAVRGDPSVDVALTWALVASGEVPARGARGTMVAVGRRQLLDAFLQALADDGCRAVLGAVVAWKCTDPNLSTTEAARMRALAASEGT